MFFVVALCAVLGTLLSNLKSAVAWKGNSLQRAPRVCIRFLHISLYSDCVWYHFRWVPVAQRFTRTGFQVIHGEFAAPFEGLCGGDSQLVGAIFPMCFWRFSWHALGRLK